MWQDWVIAACQWGFALVLLPTVFGKEKPEVMTALGTAVLAGIVAITFFTIPLVWAGVATSSTVLLWVVIAVQSWHRRRQARPGGQRKAAA